MKRPSLIVGSAVGTALVLAAALLPEIYQAAGKTVPDWMFQLSRFIIFAVFVIGIPTWLFIWVIAPTWRFLKSRRYQWPMVDKAKPDPNQWLLDIAQQDADNPTQLLLVLDSTVTGKDLNPDLPMPWIELGVELYNCNVHAVSVGSATGRARFNGKELPEPIEGTDGKSNKPRGHKHFYRMKQYLPPEFAAQIYEELVEETKVCGPQRRKELRSLDLSGVSIKVECNGHSKQLPLTDIRRFRHD